MSVTKPTNAEITQEIIEAWKLKHGKITEYTTTDGKRVIFRTPTRAEIAAAEAAKQDSDGVTSNEVLCKAMALGGDIEILSQNKYLFGLGKHIAKMMEKVEGETKEL